MNKKSRSKNRRRSNMPKVPQVKPDWPTGIYCGGIVGTIVEQDSVKKEKKWKT